MGFLVENKMADDAVRRNAGAGFHYFDRDTMRCFGSKVHEGYDLGGDATLVIMSNRDKNFGTVVNGRRHYYLVVVEAAGNTTSRLKPTEFHYSVSNGTGYWMSLASARKAARRFQKLRWGK